MDIAAQAEKELIGSIILAPEKLVHIADTVQWSDFSCRNARSTYTHALAIWKAKDHVDASAIIAREKSLAAYLASAMESGFPPAIKKQASQVATYAKERRVKQGCTEIANSNEPVSGRIEQLLRLYQQEMFINRKDPSSEAVLRRFSERVKENSRRGVLGISTGFDFLEEKYIQYVPGHVWVMGGYTSTGKTAMMVQKICNLLSGGQNPSIVIISTEMSEEQIVSRIMGNFTGIYSQKILAGHLHQHEEEAVEEFKKMLAAADLKIYDDIYELSDIETAFRKADLQGGVNVGFIDYVQNCRVSAATSQYQEGSMLAKGIQKLAKDVRATIVCLSQLSNDVGRGNTEQLEFKGAGEWAAVADIGIWLKKKDEKLKYLIKKNRHGPLHEHLFEYSQNFSRLNPLKPL